MRQKEPACFFDFFDLFGHARVSAGSLRCRPTQSRSYREQPMLIEPYAARPHIEREKSGRRSRPPLSNVVQEQSGRRHLHRLFGLRNVVSANDRHASGLAQLARGRPSNAEMIAETKWDDHADLSCAAYKQCRRRMIFIRRPNWPARKPRLASRGRFLATGLITPMG